jgi:deoxycytidylate deaminase
MKEKFIKKYMRIAKLIGQDQNPCHSRKIGAVIVDPVSNRILGTGYNGPAPGTPHPTSEEFLREFFWPQLTEDEKLSIYRSLLVPKTIKNAFELDTIVLDAFIKEYKDKPICPRRIIGAGAGQRSELCSCGHAERHAITNAAQCCHGAYMFCWCGVPCIQCTDSIIQSGIAKVYCLKEADYQEKSRWLFSKSKCIVHEHLANYYLSD